MKVITTFLLSIVATTFANNVCYQDSVEACQLTSKNVLTNCNAQYGSIGNFQTSLEHYANHFIHTSFKFLLMSTYFGNYAKNRPGFQKLYRSLSDSSWNDGIELIKYIDSRGGNITFINIAEEVGATQSDNKLKVVSNWELNELQSLAMALDIEKSLASEAFRIHQEAEGQETLYDPEIGFHIEEEFLNKERDIIRKLAGYTYDLGKLLNTTDASLAVYLFDEILQNEKY